MAADPARRTQSGGHFCLDHETFVERHGIAYRDALIERIKLIAQGQPPHPRPCDLLMQGHASADDLVYYREGGHYIVMRDSEDMLGRF